VTRFATLPAPSIAMAEGGGFAVFGGTKTPRFAASRSVIRFWQDLITIDNVEGSYKVLPKPYNGVGRPKETPAIVNMSASLGKSAEERLEAVLALKPDIATVIVGSMNYGLFNKSKNQGVSSFSQTWEQEAFGEKAYQIVTQNSFATIARMIDTLIEHDIAMEFECYDIGHLYILDHHLSRRSNIKRPIIVQFLTGILGGIPSDIDHLVHLKRTSERLFGDAVELFTHGTGTGNIKAATYGAMMGTHIRVGQEDNLFEKPDVPFKSNAHQVEKVIGILSALNIEVASAQEAKQILGLSN
jgi:uncharacterized protein (DUF849 family)